MLKSYNILETGLKVGQNELSVFYLGTSSVETCQYLYSSKALVTIFFPPFFQKMFDKAFENCLNLTAVILPVP